MKNLHPEETVQKILISTTSRLVGEYEIEGLLITHAWPNPEKAPIQISLTENPLSRNAFVVVFKTPPVDRGKVVLPNYAPTGDLICVHLAILFGKRFDSHGPIESIGHFRLPDLSLYSTFCDPNLPQNNHRPRSDIGMDLHLCNVIFFEKIITGKIDDRFNHFLSSAGRFYLQALQSYEKDPEKAYLNLITCGEILSNYFEYEHEELLDKEARDILSQIEKGLDNGSNIAKKIKGRLFQVKRRFVKTITHLLNDYFFENTESQYEQGKLKKEKIEQHVSAAYDLRSRYVHTGIDFGKWVAVGAPGNSEVQIGIPVVEDKEFQKILTKAPSYVGLERIMRFCLLRFIHLQGIRINDRLNDNRAEQAV